jgi:hypothetical protein
MAYLIYKSDGTSVNVPDNIIDTVYYNPTGGSTGTGMGVQLLGQNSIAYGPAVAQNFLQMQENFASNVVPSDTYSLQGQLWFNKSSSSTGNLYVRISDSGTGGILNWRQLVVTDTTGNIVVGGTVTATQFIGPVDAIGGGTANQIVVQTAANTTGFIPAPTISGTFLEWNGSAFVWTTTPITGTVTSVAVTSASSALTVAGSPITSSGTITLTPHNFASGTPGIVPASGGGNLNFLRADGTWAVPPGTAPGGTVTSVGVSSIGANSTAITIAGSPITSAGTITVTANTFTSVAPGIVPASGGSTSNFLRADGTWTAPPTGGTVTSVAVNSGGAAISIAGSPITTSGAITVTANTFGAGAPGVVPASGGGTSNFLRADGTWATPGVVSQNLSTNGYIIFSSGLIEQWCETAGSASSIITINYPMTFPTASFTPRVSATNPNATSGGANNFIGATVISHTLSNCRVAIGAISVGSSTTILLDVRGY